MPPGAFGQGVPEATEQRGGTVGCEASLFVVHKPPMTMPELRDANLA